MKKLNPLVIVILWISSSLLFALIIMVILGLNTPDGEQQPFIFLSKFIYIIIYGIILFSLVTIPFYIKWSKKYWIFHVLLIVSCCLLLFAGHKNNVDAEFTVTYNDTIIGQKKYTRVIEYYEDDLSVRSISFLHNNKKEGIETQYTKDGNIISQLEYRQDTFIAILKSQE